MNALSHPSDDQIQCTTTGYTKPVRNAEYPAYATMEHRSATAPETIVAAVAANANWKNHDSYVNLCSNPFPRKKLSFPMNQFPVWSSVRAPYAKANPVAQNHNL